MNCKVRDNEIDLNSKKLFNKKTLRSTFLSHKPISKTLDLNLDAGLINDIQ